MTYKQAGNRNLASPLKRILDCHTETGKSHGAKVPGNMMMTMKNVNLFSVGSHAIQKYKRRLEATKDSHFG
jgi:hypothetical protein